MHSINNLLSPRGGYPLTSQGLHLDIADRHFRWGEYSSVGDHTYIFSGILYASKLIMRHEWVVKKLPSPCQVQMDCRYDEEPRQESEPASENGSPGLQAKGRTCSDDDYA